MLWKRTRKLYVVAGEEIGLQKAQLNTEATHAALTAAAWHTTSTTP